MHTIASTAPRLTAPADLGRSMGSGATGALPLRS